jgi:allophanate hydrolase subunit 1
LQAIRNLSGSQEKLIEEDMRFLKIDITFDSDSHNDNAEVLPHMGI